MRHDVGTHAIDSVDPGTGQWCIAGAGRELSLLPAGVSGANRVRLS